MSEQLDVAFDRAEETGEHAQQRALAAAVGAEQRDLLTLEQLEVDVAQDKAPAVGSVPRRHPGKAGDHFALSHRAGPLAAGAR